MTTSTTPDRFFNPLNPDHIADPDGRMHESRIGCPVGRVSDILYTVNTDADVRQIFDDTKHFSNKGNFSEDSRKFLLDRPNASAHLAFGRGIHTCIGAPLARIEARVAIGALLDRYPDMALAPDAQWVKLPAALTRRVEAVPVLLTGKEIR